MRWTAVWPCAAAEVSRRRRAGELSVTTPPCSARRAAAACGHGAEQLSQRRAADEIGARQSQMTPMTRSESFARLCHRRRLAHVPTRNQDLAWRHAPPILEADVKELIFLGSQASTAKKEIGARSTASSFDLETPASSRTMMPSPTPFRRTRRRRCRRFTRSDSTSSRRRAAGRRWRRRR